MSKKYLAAAAAASLALGAYQIFLLLGCFDKDIEMYVQNSILPVFLYVGIAVLGVLFLIPAFVKNKDEAPMEFPKLSRISAVLCWVCGGAAVLSAIVRLAMLNDRHYTYGMAAIARILAFICIVLSVIAAFHFILLALKGGAYKNITAGSAFFPVLWAAALLMCDYFDFTSPINASLGILSQLSLISIMVFLLFELRTLLGIGRAGGYFASGLLTVTFVCVTALPALLLTAVGYFEFSYATALYFTQLALGGYAASRLFSAAK